MSKSLVKAAHPGGPYENGAGGCFTRWSNAGFCSGEVTAQWLNSLGEDEEPYGRAGRITNLRVRENWVHGAGHVVWVTTPIYDTCQHCGGMGRVKVG